MHQLASMPPVPHGGDLGAAAERYGIPIADWLDCSTGINPNAYPATLLAEPLTVLPQADAMERLLQSARAGYGLSVDQPIVAAPGTQAILQWLPVLMPVETVAILGPTYGEHARLWGSVAAVRIVPRLEDAVEADLVVVVNPNNPDGRIVPPADLQAFAKTQEGDTPRLIVDEAFCDVCPHTSVAGAKGTLVLKSFGKFFGLPGLRLGFAIGALRWVMALQTALGPWAVGGSALAVGAEALADAAWIAATRTHLADARRRLDGVLKGKGLTVIGGTDLFRLVAVEDAKALHHRLAREGVWTRRFDAAPTHLRIGLPADEARFERALARATE
ncbi:MAG: threonine-phosphate decarboxylase CobD [Pseudomonadota bacterium]